jgi:hypothetical protein
MWKSRDRMNRPAWRQEKGMLRENQLFAAFEGSDRRT